MNVVLLTGAELRHEFVRRVFSSAPGVRLAGCVQEGVEKSLRAFVQSKQPGSSLRLQHVEARERSERDFFGNVIRWTPSSGCALHIPKGSLNHPEVANRVLDSEPDLLCAYGCSLVREPLLSALPGRFLNLHLGLSPYYRGSGTNFWPLVNGEPEFVGATFMHIEAGIDTGVVIHQIRARIFPGDTPHQIGNRLISDAAAVYVELVRRFDEIEPQPQIAPPPDAKFYRRSDFTTEAVSELYRRFDDGLIDRYLAHSQKAGRRARLVVQPFLSELI